MYFLLNEAVAHRLAVEEEYLHFSSSPGSASSTVRRKHAFYICLNSLNNIHSYNRMCSVVGIQVDMRLLRC